MLLWTGKASAELMFEPNLKKWLIIGHINEICMKLVSGMHEAVFVSFSFGSAYLYWALFCREALHTVSKTATSYFISTFPMQKEIDLIKLFSGSI